MPPVAQRTKGTVLRIGNGAVPEVFLTVGAVFNISPVEGTRETVDVTNLDSPGDAREFVATMIDYGEIAVQYRFRKDADSAGQAAMRAALTSGEIKNVQVVFPAAIGMQWNAAVLVTKSGTAEAAVEGVLNGAATLKVSGVGQLVASV